MLRPRRKGVLAPEAGFDMGERGIAAPWSDPRAEGILPDFTI